MVFIVATATVYDYLSSFRSWKSLGYSYWKEVTFSFKGKCFRAMTLE